MTEPYLATLNPEQRHAVEHSGDHPLLIIAGAGLVETMSHLTLEQKVNYVPYLFSQARMVRVVS